MRALGEGTLELTQRIRMARRHGGISQATLAEQVGVHRSAVSHWESSKPKRPNIGHLLSVAVSTGGGKPMLTIEQVSPEALVRQACERAQPLYAEHGIELQCDIGSNLPAVCADVQRIQRVLANLLGMPGLLGSVD